MKVSLAITILLVASQTRASQVPVGVTIGLSPYSHPIQSLYHAQDTYGQYVYGYATPTSSKTETKSANGVTQGGYSYIDSNGILQTVQYIADPVNGFRVAATNLPRDLPDVAHAKAQHLAEFAAIKSERAQLAVSAPVAVQYSNPVAVPASAVPQVAVLPQPVQDLPEVVQARAQHLATLQAAYASGGVAPQVVQDLPEVVKARAEHLAAVEATKARNAAINLSPIPAQIDGGVVPVKTVVGAAPLPVAQAAHVSYTPAVLQAPLSSQYHAQDGYGQYTYGYVSPLSAKSETRTVDGITRGGYSYIDANGILQTVNYISDPVNGFRVAATNLPVAPKTTLIAPSAPVVQYVQARQQAPLVAQKQVVAKAAIPALYTQHIVY